MSIVHDETFAASMQRLGELIEQAEADSDQERVAPARELLSATLEVHEHGLRALLDALRAATGEQAPILLRALAHESSVASLLLLHGLHPDGLATRVERALSLAHASLPGGGATARVETIDAEQVRIRIEGSEPAGVALRHSVERLVATHAPDARLELHGGLPAPRDLVPLTRLYVRTEESA
ncbi:MAG TPA: hypothetical protein VHM19_04740 [Polyangiales bacterium]|jgi:uncharacterized membrane protein|nr:hypothetical protein [Polyangiales bacterium]